MREIKHRASNALSRLCWRAILAEAAATRLINALIIVISIIAGGSLPPRAHKMIKWHEGPKCGNGRRKSPCSTMPSCCVALAWLALINTAIMSLASIMPHYFSARISASMLSSRSREGECGGIFKMSRARGAAWHDQLTSCRRSSCKIIGAARRPSHRNEWHVS